MNLFHSIRSYFKRLGRESYQDPARDWLILVVITLTLLAGIVVYDAWAFDTVAGGGTIGAPAKAVDASFDVSSLSTIHTVFDSRAAEEAKYVGGTYHFADPSQ